MLNIFYEEVGVDMQKNVLNSCGYEHLVGNFQKGNQSFNRFAYVYSDSYFENSADEYNPSLSTMSLCLAISTYVYKMFDDGVDIYSNQSKNLKLLLKELGFRKIELNSDFKSEPTLQTIGVATGYKKINLNGKNYTLVPIVIRSCEYGAEWGNNMLAGISGNHYGFDRAANIAKKFIDKYINKTREIEGDIKFWIVGYSRGGAVAGLIGRLYNDYYDIYKSNRSFAVYNKNISINKDDIYTYTFESPNGFSVKNSRHSGKYLNIHNVVNDNDYVTKVPVRYWGFCRPGVDHRILGGENREEICRMKRILSKMCFNVFGDVKMKYTADKFRACGFGWLLRDINSQSDFLDRFLKMVANCFFCGQSHDFKKRFGRNMRGLRMAYFRREKAIARLVELCASDENFSNSLAEMFNKRY